MKLKSEILDDDGPAIVEEQDIVYREAARSGAARSVQRPDRHAAWRRTIVPTETMLFRYSALIFNAHRIHYDRPYAVEHEGYAGLVVHGQLTATYLAALAGENVRRPMTEFRFRALSPIVDTGPFHACGTPQDDGSAALWAETADGQLALEASAVFDGHV
jgi:3-methylfumaryl-CoA hydratase